MRDRGESVIGERRAHSYFFSQMVLRLIRYNYRSKDFRPAFSQLADMQAFVLSGTPMMV